MLVYLNLILRTENTMQSLNLTDLETMTLAYGEGWAPSHIRRVLHLAEEIGPDLTYDLHAFKVAAYLHDWGAFPHYRLPGIEHALRSRQLAE
ncbi:MAG: HD domain-containing protein, partial [Anaerolineales bacterium]